MSRTPIQEDGGILRDVLSVADLLEEPRLARLYSSLARADETTVQELQETLDLAQGTAYSYVNRLVDAGLVEVTREVQPRTYAARDIELTITSGSGLTYTITPALVDAVGRRETDADIDTYIDRHGLASLATALTYAVRRERGEVTHRQMAAELDISPLAAEIILQALRPVVHEHREIVTSGISLDEMDDIDDADVTREP